jgi:hypothetical protein
MFSGFFLAKKTAIFNISEIFCYVHWVTGLACHPSLLQGFVVIKKGLWAKNSSF